MRFFTPDLYVEFNSDDATVADRADEAWENAVSDYRGRIAHLRSQLPPAVQDLAENVCLHDADYLGYTITPVPKSTGETAMVAVRQHQNVVLIFYVLAEEPTLSPAHHASVFSDRRVLWLYDEVDLVGDGVFSHQVLLSNGRVLSFHFVALDMMTVNWRDFERFSTGEINVTASG